MNTITHTARTICTDQITDDCQIMLEADFFSLPKNLSSLTAADRSLITSTYLSALLLLLIVPIGVITLVIRSSPTSPLIRLGPTNPTRPANNTAIHLKTAVFILLLLFESLSSLLFLIAPLTHSSTIPCWLFPFISYWLCFEPDLLFVLEAAISAYCARYLSPQ